MTVTSCKSDTTDKDKDKDKEEDKENFNPNSNEFRLSFLLFSKIRERDAKHKKPNLQKWSEHIEKLHRLDKRDFKEIEDVIIWSQNNEFWQNNILSTEKLRKQFPRLFLSMQEEAGKIKQNQEKTTLQLKTNFY